MDIDQGQAPLRRDNRSNPSLHNTPPIGGPLAIFFPSPGHKLSHRGETLANFWSPGQMDTNQRRTKLGRGGALAAVGRQNLTEEGGGGGVTASLRRNKMTEGLTNYVAHRPFI